MSAPARRRQLRCLPRSLLAALRAAARRLPPPYPASASGGRAASGAPWRLRSRFSERPPPPLARC